MSYSDMGAPWPVRAANRWGHWATHLLVASVIAAIVLGLRPPQPDSPLAIEAPALLFAFVLMSWYLLRQHDRALCEACMSSLPLDASAAAVRYDRRLAVAHLALRAWLTGGYLIVLIASGPLLLSTDLVPSTVGKWMWAAIQSSLVYLLLSYSTHRKLQPWCTRCQGGDGGHDHIDTPDPVPTGSSSF